MGRIKTLLVDDDYLVLNDLKKLVDWKGLGFDIVGTAATGFAALRMVESLHPSLVLTDLSMPVMDGFHFTNKLQEEHPEIYIVYVTSYADFDYAKRAIDFGIRDYILKNEITSEFLTQKLIKIRTIIEENHFSAQKTLSQKLTEYYRDSSSILPTTKHSTWTFFLLSDHFPLERLKDHFLRTETSGRDLLQLFSAHISSNYPESIIFSYDQFLIIAIPSASYTSPLSEGLIRYIAKDLRKMAIQERPNILCLHSSTKYNLTAFREVFIKMLPFIRFFCLVPQQEICSLSIFTQMKFVPNNQLFPYDKVKKYSSHPVELLSAIVNQLHRFFESKDADSLLMFYHNLTLQFEELSEHTLSLSTPLYITSEEELIAFWKEKIEECCSLSQTIQLKSVSPIIEMASDYIRRNFSRSELTIQEIANELQISSSRLSVLFKKETGLTMNEHLTNVRISQGIYLLENTTLKIYEIANATGYKSSQYFSQAFQSKTGHKPLDYRRKNNSHLESHKKEKPYETV